MQGKGIAAPLDIAGLCFEGELAVCSAWTGGWLRLTPLPVHDIFWGCSYSPFDLCATADLGKADGPPVQRMLLLL